MVAQDADIHFHGRFETLARIGPIPNDITKAVDLRDFLLTNVLQDNLQGFVVSVNVAEYRPSHGSLNGS
jgi:hypothetical protein